MHRMHMIESHGCTMNIIITYFGKGKKSSKIENNQLKNKLSKSVIIFLPYLKKKENKTTSLNKM